MVHQADETVDVLQAIWSAAGQSRADIEEECGPQKSCKNLQHVSFDGLAGPGSDLREAWRQRLESEGKRNTSEGTIRDLVLGPDADS